MNILSFTEPDLVRNQAESVEMKELTKKKKVYVKAYYKCNLGDDLFLKTLVRRYPSVLFYFCERRDQLKIISEERNVEIVGKLEYLWLRLVRKIENKSVYVENQRIIRKALAIVRIGGSIFIENAAWTSSSEISCDFYIGCNFGPYKTQEYFNYQKNMIAKSRDACFRDNYSYSLFADLPNTRVAPDIIWGYPFFPAADPNGRGIAISVINMEDREVLRDSMDYYEDMIRAICRLGQKKQLPVKLLSFCAYEKDPEAIKRIMDGLDTVDGIETVFYEGDIDSMLNAINDCQLVIAARFHAMIIGWSLEKSVFPVIYSEKQTNTLKDIDFQGDIWNLKNGDLLGISRIEQILATNGNKLETGTLKEQAQLQFKALDEFLNTK